MQRRWSQALCSDTRARCSIHKLEHRRFHVSIRKHFHAVQVMGALAQVAWSLPPWRTQKPLGHCPGHPALVGLLKQGRGQMDLEVPASLSHSAWFCGISGAWICKDTCMCNDCVAQLCTEGSFVELHFTCSKFLWWIDMFISTGVTNPLWKSKVLWFYFGFNMAPQIYLFFNFWFW